MDKEKRILIYMTNAHAITHAISNTNGCRTDRVSEININPDNIVSIEFDGWDTK